MRGASIGWVVLVRRSREREGEMINCFALFCCNFVFVFNDSEKWVIGVNGKDHRWAKCQFFKPLVGNL